MEDHVRKKTFAMYENKMLSLLANGKTKNVVSFQVDVPFAETHLSLQTF